MRLQDKFKLGSFITGKIDQEFRWGQNDCNTFFIELHDKLYGTNDLSRVVDQYFDRNTAKKFLTDLGLTPAQWLHMRNYRRIPDLISKSNNFWQDGDVAIFQHKVFASVYVYFDGAFWTVPEGQTMKGYHPDALTKHNIQGWRKDG